LQALPGIGPKIAQAIIAHRLMRGPFTGVDQLDEVPMVGPDKIEALRGLVRPWRAAGGLAPGAPASGARPPAGYIINIVYPVLDWVGLVSVAIHTAG